MPLVSKLLKSNKVATAAGIATAIVLAHPHPFRDASRASSFMATGNENTLRDYNGFAISVGAGMAANTLMGQAPGFDGYQSGMSAMSHANLGNDYNGYTPNVNAGTFVNNFDENGYYDGEAPPSMAEQMSSGRMSSAMNLNPQGSMLFGMYNNRLK